MNSLDGRLGAPISRKDIRARKAQEVVEILRVDLLPFVRLVGITRRSDGTEVVRVEVQPEVPTDPVNDIRVVEPIAIGFDPEDRHQPIIWTLRDDFPDLPHTFLVQEGAPKSLCLYDEPYSEQRLHWTAPAFIRRIHWWLGQTALGELHLPDQPVEPLLLGSPAHVVLPNALFDVDADDAPRVVHLHAVPRESRTAVTYVAEPGPNVKSPERVPNCMAMVLDASPQTHRGLARNPRHLLELDEFLRPMDVDLHSRIGRDLRTWVIDQRDSPEAVALIILRIPVRRSDDSIPERVEVRAFAIDRPVGELGEALGVIAEAEGFTGALVGAGSNVAELEGVPIQSLNPVRCLSQRRVRALHGTRDQTHPKVVAIGAGALGSQTIMNLVRGGYGEWIVADRDVLLPHNLVRHTLPGAFVGCEKAEAIAILANGLFESGASVAALNVDVLDRPIPDRLRDPLATADVVIDFSASVAVARWAARDAPGNARRISVFLNPNGTDLVLMAEDGKRTVRLDQIEAQYYRAVTGQPELAEHLRAGAGQWRYGHTCRDVTSRIRQDALSVFAGIAARAIREAIAQRHATSTVWQLASDHSVSCLPIDSEAPIVVDRSGWRVHADKGLLTRFHGLRTAALPNETGGVLVGCRDQQRGLLYVVDTIPSPSDSDEWPTGYVRGCAGLGEAVERMAKLTGGEVGYLGEWHTHPDGAPCRASRHDRTFLAWLAQHMAVDGAPGLMAIVCEGEAVHWEVAAGAGSEEER